MSTSAVAAVGNLICLPFKLVGGAVVGSSSAISSGKPAGFAAIAESERNLFHVARDFSSTHVGAGMEGIEKSGIAGKLANIGTKEGFGEVIKTLTGTAAEGGVGARGLGLLAARVAGSIGLAVFGFKTMVSSAWKLSQSMKGYSPMDYTGNPLVHGASALAGLGMFVGGIAAMVPGAGVVGTPLALAGLGLWGATKAVSYLLYTPNMFSYPKDYAPWPLSTILEGPASAFRNMHN